MTRAALPGSQFPSGNLWKILPLAMLLCATFVLPTLAQEKEKLWRTLSVSGAELKQFLQPWHKLA